MSLALPPTPLFKDAVDGGSIIPQEPLFNLLKKFDGNTSEVRAYDSHPIHTWCLIKACEFNMSCFVSISNCAQLLADGSQRFYSIKRLPRYLIVHIKRFTENQFRLEKNPTIVNFPVKNLDLREYVARETAPDEAALRTLGISDLKKALQKRGTFVIFLFLFVMARSLYFRACSVAHSGRRLGGRLR